MRHLLTFLLPAALLLTGCSTPTPTEPDTTPSVEPSRSAEPTEQVEQVEPSPRAGGLAALRSLPESEAPRVEYVQNFVLHRPNGRPVALPRLPYDAGIAQITRYDRGFLVRDNRNFEGVAGIFLVTQGKRRRVDKCSYGAAVSQDRQYVAWVTTSCPESGIARASVAHRSGPAGVERQELGPLVEGTAPVVSGFQGSDVVFAPRFAPRGRSSPSPLVADLTHQPRPVQGRVERPINGVYPPRSPDGTRIVKTPGHGESLIVRDRGTRSVLTRIDLPKGVLVGRSRWEDDGHLLAEVSAGKNYRQQAVIRTDLEGNLTRATAVVRSKGYADVFAFLD